MTRILGVPEKEAGWLRRFAYRFSRRRFGEVPEPVRVTAHHLRLLLGTGAMELALDRSDLAASRATGEIRWCMRQIAIERIRPPR